MLLHNMKQQLGSLIEDTSSQVFSVSGSTWEIDIIKKAIIEFPWDQGLDPAELEVRLRYAALEHPTWTLRDVLCYAIGCCLPFRIMFPICATLPSLTAPPNLILTDEQSVLHLVAQWKEGVRLLLQSPHSRALLFMGGIEARIAIRFGGDEFVRRAMSVPMITDGRNVLRVVDGQSYLEDKASPSEVNLLLGCLLPIPPHKVECSLWPSSALLREMFAEGFRCEWNTACEQLFNHIWVEVHSSKPQLRTSKQWRSFFRHGGHTNRTLPSSTDEKIWTNAKSEFRAADGREWQGARLAHLNL